MKKPKNQGKQGKLNKNLKSIKKTKSHEFKSGELNFGLN